MKRMLTVMALALVPVLAQPPRLQGQCNEACVRIEMPEGKGFGCITQNDSGTACIARSTICYVKLCYNAMVIDPSGSMLASADVCRDQVTVRPVRRGPASRRSARPQAPTRSAIVASVAVAAAVRVG